MSRPPSPRCSASRSRARAGGAWSGCCAWRPGRERRTPRRATRHGLVRALGPAAAAAPARARQRPLRRALERRRRPRRSRRGHPRRRAPSAARRPASTSPTCACAAWCETGLLGHAYVIFFFVGEVGDGTLRPAPGVELAWHDLARVHELPLVPDLHELLPALLTNPEPVLAVERYDGADRPLAFAFEGEVGAPRGGSL
jgi:hypothetical protein